MRGDTGFVRGVTGTRVVPSAERKSGKHETKAKKQKNNVPAIDPAS